MANSRYYKLRKFIARPKSGGEYVNYSMTVAIFTTYKTASV